MSAFPRLNKRGFTLLELIVVMVLLAVVASFAGPQISSFLYGDQLKVTVRKLVGLISESSQLAQRRQVSYLLKYNESDRRFFVEPEFIKDEAESDKNEQWQDGKNGGLHLAEAVVVKDIWSWYGGTRSPEESVIRFTKNGYVEPTVIHLQEEGGKEISLVLSPFLGKIQVLDKYVAPDKETLFQ